MRLFFTLILLLLTAILQTTLVPFLAIVGVIPNLVLIFVLFLVIQKGFGSVWWLIILAGFFLDSLSGLPFGLISLSLVAVAALTDWFNKKIFSLIKFWVIVILVFLASLVYNLTLAALAKIFVAELSFNFRYFVIETFYNLLTITLFYGAKKIFQFSFFK